MENNISMTQSIFALAIALVFLVLSVWIWGRIAVKCGKSFWSYGIGMLVPIVNCFLLANLAEKSALWAFAFFIPVLNIVAMVIVFGSIAERLGKSYWLYGIGSMVPILNIILFISLALEK